MAKNTQSLTTIENISDKSGDDITTIVDSSVAMAELKHTIAIQGLVSDTLNALLIRQVENIGILKLWKYPGSPYKDFAHFLDTNDILQNHFRRQRFYELLEALNALQSKNDLFNALLHSGVPPTTIKILAKENDVEMDFDESTSHVIINGERLPMSQPANIRRVMRSFKAALTIRDRERADDKEENEKLKKQLANANAETNRVKASKMVDLDADTNPIVMAVQKLAFAFGDLIAEVEKLSADGKAQWREKVYQRLVVNENDLDAAFDLRGSGKNLRDPIERVEIVPVDDPAANLTDEEKAAGLEYFFGSAKSEIETDAKPDDNNSELAKML